MLPARFWAKVAKTESCWLWTGATSVNGYGRFRLNGRHESAHRLTYIDMVGPILPGWDIDHICRVRACCNPAHLEAVPHGENVARGLTGRVNHHNRRKTHCPQGHPYDEANTSLSPRGWRYCRTCRREHMRVYAARARAQQPAEG